jgi:hypothetical protein
VLGAELACVFAIFTSQAWNMTFSMYQSIRNVPKDLEEASQSFHLSGWQRFRSESFVHTRSSAGFTITTSRFKFSVHTGRERSQIGPSAAFRYWTSAERKPFSFRKRDQAKKLAECCSGTVVRRFRMPE